MQQVHRAAGVCVAGVSYSSCLVLQVSRAAGVCVAGVCVAGVCVAGVSCSRCLELQVSRAAGVSCCRCLELQVSRALGVSSCRCLATQLPFMTASSKHRATLAGNYALPSYLWRVNHSVISAVSKFPCSFQVSLQFPSFPAVSKFPPYCRLLIVKILTE